MKKTLVLWALAALLFLPGCKKYALKEDLKSLESRVAALERLCDQMNGNIASLQTVVNALQNNDCVTSVVSVAENGKTVGYTINFAKNPAITIYNGADGADGKDGAAGKDGEKGTDGYTPVIGIRQDTDSVWYWTLDGNWLTDNSGNRVRAEGGDGTDGTDGTDGKDGITPQFRIQEGCWEISYDNGGSWTRLGKAAGADGKDADAAFFASVTEDEDYVYLLLNGSSKPIAIPKNHPLSVSFDNTEDIRVLPNQTYLIRYSITGGDENTVIKAVAQDGYRAIVKAESYSEGILEITTPSAIVPSEVLVFVTDGKERTIMRSINFIEEDVIIVSSRSYTIGHEGGTVSVEVAANIEYTVEIVILPEEDESWISVELPTRATMRQETLNFTVARNKWFPYLWLRYAIVKLIDDNGVVSETILIIQREGSRQDVSNEKAGSLGEKLVNVDKESVEALKITGHLGSDDYAFIRTLPNLQLLDLSELDDDELPSGCFEACNRLAVLLPSHLKKINDRAFYKATLFTLFLPETVEVIGDYAFYECVVVPSPDGSHLVIPEATRSIGEYCFYGSEFSTLTLGRGVEIVGKYAFYGCRGLTGDLIIPDSVTTLGEYAFASSGFTGLVVGNGVTEIPEGCFNDSRLAGTLQLGENIVYIGSHAFSYCNELSGNLVIPDNVQTISDFAFFDCTGFKGYLLLGSSLKEIGARTFAMEKRHDDGAYITSPLYFSKIYCKASDVPLCSDYTFGIVFHGGDFDFHNWPEYYFHNWPEYLGVPFGRKEAYSIAEGWRNFATIEEINFD